MEKLTNTPKNITDLIAESDIAHVNKLTATECDELAIEIEAWLTHRAESLEGLFDPDSEEDVLVIPLSSLAS